MEPSLESDGKCVLDLQFLPCIDYFIKLKQFKEVIIDHHEKYLKQTCRNRCYILGANNVIQLVVPVKKGSQRRPMNEVEIDYTHVWINTVWRSIASAYGKAPFFEFFWEDLHRMMVKKHELLFQLNSELLTFCLKCLKLDENVAYSKSYIKPGRIGITDLRSSIKPFNAEINDINHNPTRYTQIFGNKFVPNLSIIDLLFCEGPRASEIIANSK